jgi:hypothetical protein
VRLLVPFGLGGGTVTRDYRFSYTCDVPYSQGGKDWIAEVVVYPVRSEESPIIEAVYPDNNDPNAEPDAAALEALLSDKHLPDECFEYAMEEASDREEDAAQAAAEERTDMMREEERQGDR